MREKNANYNGMLQQDEMYNGKKRGSSTIIYLLVFLSLLIIFGGATSHIRSNRVSYCDSSNPVETRTLIAAAGKSS